MKHERLDSAVVIDLLYLLRMLSDTRFWWIFALIACVPYGMYVVAFVFEGRRPGNGPDNVPVWRGQSKAFFPGDLFLSLFAAIGVYYYTSSQMNVWINIGLAAVASGVVFCLANVLFAKSEDYTAGARKSPSKLYHDIVMYAVFPFLFVMVCLPYYAARTIPIGHSFIYTMGWLSFVAWFALLFYDNLRDEVPNERQHPSVWTPIWRKSSRTVDVEVNTDVH